MVVRKWCTPMGLAILGEEYSIITVSFLLAPQPNLFFFLIISLRIKPRFLLSKKKFINPGGAISVVKPCCQFHFSSSISTARAISRGFFFKVLASIRAILAA